MAINKAVFTGDEDVFVEYDYEEVMFRWEASTNLIFKKFYGTDEHPVPVHHTDKFFNDALVLGERITKERYDEGSVR